MIAPVHYCLLNLLTLSGIVPIRHVWYPRYRIARLTATLKSRRPQPDCLVSFIGAMLLLIIVHLVQRVRRR